MPAAKGKRPTTTTKKPAARSTSGSAAKRSGTGTRAKKRHHSNIPWPAIGMMLFAAGVFMLFTLFTPSNAVALVAVRGFVNGMFGKLGTIACLLIVYGGLQLALGERWPAKRVLWVQLALIAVCVMTLMQVHQVDGMLRALRSEGYVQNYNGFLWKSYYASRNIPVGGGSVGGLLAYPMGRYLEVLGSTLVLALALVGLVLWVIRTLWPTAGEQLMDWYEGWRDDMLERREERAAEREAERAAREADAALLVPLPAELMQADEEEERPAARVAKGRKRKPEPRPAPAAASYAAQDDWHEEPGWQEPYAAEPALQQGATAKKPAPVVRPAPPVKATARPAQRAPVQSQAARAPRPRLYIEEERPATRPLTAFDIEQRKYQYKPQAIRQNDGALPDFISEQRAKYDAQYGPIRSGLTRAEQSDAGEDAPAPRMRMEAQDEGYEEETSPYAESVFEGGYTPEYGFETPEDTLPWEDADAPPEPEEEDAPVQPQKDYYQHQSPLDKQPKLDPQTRLDRPDWKPPEPEAPKERAQPAPKPYRKPPYSLLERDEHRMRVDTREADAIGAAKLEETLQSFGVTANVLKVVHGPAITRYELQPAPGVKVSKIVNLTDDIALNMAAVGVRIEAPIPGKAAIGIEIANDEVQTVHLRDVIESDESRKSASKLAVALGKDIAGKRIIADLARMPHLLIAGATGSGKSVCINTIIASIIFRATPEEVRLILIDPKKVELAVYNGIPHLLVPVVTDPKKASGALNWAVMEMDERYKLFAEIGVRDIKGYNAHRGPDTPLMPQIVVIIDELSDLMLVAPGEVEESICRIAQLARACGIHLVVATQRPSVNVITGIIKANVPSRIAFAVSSQVDSRTILDGAGAEKLLGKGDMLFAPSGGGKPLRVQGCFVSDEEVARVVEYVKDRHTTDYSQAVIDALDTQEEEAPEEAANESEFDALFVDAVEMAIESGQASISMLQRRMRIGYARAGRIVDEMSRYGVIGPADGAKPREVLMTREEFKLKFGK